MKIAKRFLMLFIFLALAPIDYAFSFYKEISRAMTNWSWYSVNRPYRAFIEEWKALDE